MKKGEDYVGVTVVYFCHDGDGNFLMNYRSDKCRDEHWKWDPGGGGLEHGDTVELTLRKEIGEEYCTDVLDVHFLGYRDVHREHDGKKTHWIALDHLVRVDRAKVQNGEPHKFAEIGWFRFDALPQPLSRAMEIFLERHGDQIRSRATR